jgi:HlyD family secretion protein
MSRHLRIGIALASLVLGAIIVWTLTRPGTGTGFVVQTAPMLRTLQFSARAATPSRVDVGATITGRVAQVLVAEGAQVRQGQVLLRLEADEWQAALAQAQAAERQAAARLSGLRSTGRSGVQAGMVQADAVMAAAQADLRRTQELVASGFLSPARLDDAKRAVQVAQAQQAGAQAQISAIGEQGADVSQAQAQLALAAAATQAARVRLTQTALLAPADARVLSRQVEPGQIVQPGRALLTLALNGPLQLVAPVDERYLQQLQPGLTASVVADAYPQQRFVAQVLSISPLVDAQRGAIEVKLSVAQPPAFLREDMTLSVEVETGRRDQALALPVGALRKVAAAAASGAADPGVGTVWLAREGRVQARQVRLGLRTLEAVEVVEGLAAGDTVLVGPAPAPGSRVKVQPITIDPGKTAGGSSAKGTLGDATSSMSNAMGR